jgi:ABC-type Fe3+-siderophore transport system permease subunit
LPTGAEDGAVPVSDPGGLLSTFIGAPYFIYLLRKQSR